MCRNPIAEAERLEDIARVVAWLTDRRTSPRPRESTHGWLVRREQDRRAEEFQGA